MSSSHFFSKKYQHICISLDVNFNESLTNDVVSFEQLGPGSQIDQMKFNLKAPFTIAVDYILTFLSEKIRLDINVNHLLSRLT